MTTSSARQKAHDIGEIISAAEAARRLSISKQNLIRRTNDGSVPGKKLGKIWLYRASTIATLVP